ncbi:NUDIX domain-containing protein [Paenibacillus sp. NEAU-GSW1]|uniref:NUDIX hydrolase n=1 Tax=Paenibacillus sp. NEAU-GSW1 TaxID=2682486 RepID=UPI0012E2AD25|nr:NUDIX domain-containing protein [Paenibacillus sp. NEAU-GSW1]MUT65996.1 NUDIX domain-containing protein [Paenibacillus sp. NEAU-GSW1]
MAEELFDIYDEQLNPLGTAPRSEAHAQGYWHRTFHCWLTRREGNRRYVRFQLRQSGKDTFPGHYDITAAGHLSAGETMRDAVRELKEELGVSVRFEDLILLKQVQEEKTGTANGIPFIDREFSDVFGCVCDLPLSALTLQVEEVAGIYEADLEQLLALFDGMLPELTAHGIEVRPDGVQSASERIVRSSQFVPRDAGYFAEVMRALRACT